MTVPVLVSRLLDAKTSKHRFETCLDDRIRHSSRSIFGRALITLTCPIGCGRVTSGHVGYRSKVESGIKERCRYIITGDSRTAR